MTHQVTLYMELLDEVVLSSQSSTVGEHQSLDYIPGSTLLGWAASKLYKTFTSEEAFIAFHSGKVRFGNGLPLHANDVKSYPMPLSWHEDKGGESASSHGRLNPKHLFNMAHGKPDNLKQPRQLRKGYVAEDGAVLLPLKSYRMKTAIDAATGTAAESQLFGFESLQRGQRFVASISADDSVPSELFEQLVSSFDQAIRIGRSRAAQYGRVKTRVMRDVAPAQTDVAGLKSITLWLQSDMEVRDLNGMPTLLPENPVVLGLPNGRLEIEKSFVRFRSFAPYNAHHRGYESDRQVIVAGSVLHYEFDAPLGSAEAELLSNGLGLHREVGLGVVCVNHRWLQNMQPDFSTPKPNIPLAAIRPEHPLIAYLERRNGLNKEDQMAKEWAEKQCEELESIYASARNFKGVMPTESIGPKRSQWRRVHEAVIQAHHISALFDEVDGICKSTDEDWGEEYASGKNFRSWLEETIQRTPKGVNMAMCMQWLARKAEVLCEATVKESK